MTNLIPKVPGQISAVYLPNTLVLPTKSLGGKRTSKTSCKSQKKLLLLYFVNTRRNQPIGTIGLV